MFDKFMKQMQTVICIILAVILMTLGAACSGNNGGGSGEKESEKDPPKGGEEIIDPPAPIEVYDGIAKDGESEYKIVISRDASSDILFAASELHSYLALATGAELPIVTDEQVTYSETARLISIGENDVLAAAGITVDKSLLKDCGLRYLNKGKSLFLYGGSDVGSLYAVYSYLNAAINFETYAANTTVYDENVKELPLGTYDVTEIPSFEKRIAGNNVISNSATTLKRLRQTTYVDSFIFVNGREMHNVLNYLPFSQYGAAHPKWYNDPSSPMELCYTAHGDATELTAMVETIAAVMKDHLKKNDGNVITFTQMDNYTTCGCNACKSARAQYGSDAGSIIKICNRVNKIVRDWFKTEDGKAYARDLKILFFAYQKTKAAPVRYDESAKKYVPIDNTVVCDDGVTAFMAPIELDYLRSIYDSSNSEFLEMFQKWSAVSKEISLWIYSTNFKDYLVPYDNFGKMQELYRFYDELGIEFMYDQGQLRQSGIPTGFTQLKAYLSAKLMWNTQEDVTLLTQDFFKNAYGPASEAMSKIYEEFRVSSEYLKTIEPDYGGYHSCESEKMLKSAYWNESLLRSWRGQLKTAFAAIENLKLTNSSLYDRYYTNIQAEVVWINYILYKLYDNHFDAAEQAAIKAELKTAILTTEIGQQSQSGSITDLLSELES